MQTLVNTDGLVLAGGMSTRLGQDKTALQWHGKEQQYYLADLLTNFCEEVFISKRKEPENGLGGQYKILVDSYQGIGPYGAILSAFQFRQNRAWLVVACDLPLIDRSTLTYLMANRDVRRMATTFQSPFDGLPEPLVTIWEPKSYPILLDYLSIGISCPRKALIKANDACILQPPDANALMNVNTPEDFARAKQVFENK